MALLLDYDIDAGDPEPTWHVYEQTSSGPVLFMKLISWADPPPSSDPAPTQFLDFVDSVGHQGRLELHGTTWIYPGTIQ